MQAILAIQPAPQAAQASSGSTEDGSAFKSVLASKMPPPANAASTPENAVKPADVAKKTAEPVAKKKDEKTATPPSAPDLAANPQPPLIPVPAPAQAVKGSVKPEPPRQDGAPVLAINNAAAFVAPESKISPKTGMKPVANATPETRTSSASPEKKASFTSPETRASSASSGTVAAAAAEHPGKTNPAAANIAQNGNILPQAKTSTSHASGSQIEKPVLPETKKISENTVQTVVQPQAPQVSHSHQTIPQASVSAPVGSPAWGSEIGQKVLWMSNSNQHVAELHLNPPNLGPVEVRLTLQNDQASVQFVAQHHEVRAALESSMPKLREMMMDNGIALGNATVGSGSFGQSSFGDQYQPRQQSSFAVSPVAISAPAIVHVSRISGKVDTFA